MSYQIRPQINSTDRQKLNKYSDIVAHLLYYRGLTDNESAEKFINCDYDFFESPESGICDPFKLKDIDVTIKRIMDAISAGEKICIYSDYDADGIPGAVILSDFFRKINFLNFFVYIPHRNKEGFGLNTSAIEKISEQGANLIITIDCGISDVEPIRFATELGIDVIVTDHHNPNGHISTAIAVINPHQPGCQYPDKNICGSGVIFKVVQALIRRGQEKIDSGTSSDEAFLSRYKDSWPKDGWEKWLLDMVGIATLSDMVPLIGENRIFAKYGLTVMRKSPRKGFCRLLRECKVDQSKIVEDDVGFSIAPRINAASRMDEPEMAYKMLFTDDDTEADFTVKHLHKINDERKGKVSAMVKEIKKFLGENSASASLPIVVKGNPNWQPSLLGLAASSIVEATGKPVFLWGRGDGHDFKGSCRSNGMVNLVEMMNAVKSGIIGEFGGHKMAGGFVVLEKGIFDLEPELEKAYQKTLNGEPAIEIIIDSKLLISDINYSFYKDLEKLAPFGTGNEKPIFLFENISVHTVEKFGKNKEHLKLIFKKNDNSVVRHNDVARHNRGGNGTGGSPKDAGTISAIKFFSADDENLGKIVAGSTINLVANVESSTFGRYPELRLRILEIC
ncbi:MAG TPA: single-stranded-DNA-specific exonuclease RecJ [Candidatus Paceibacterota bacterium]|nr:single-stranded-DNA-specific exonuclease RecJ [Candidatus Paceibacterota bacterium]